ncbi:hypothetical protein OSTOST_21822 [Ostertagia ostertagi]
MDEDDGGRLTSHWVCCAMVARLALPSAIGAAIFSVLVVGVSIYLVIYLMALAANAHLDVADAIVPCSEVVKNIQPTCWYALTVAVISSLFRISPDEVFFAIFEQWLRHQSSSGEWTSYKQFVAKHVV